MEIGCSLEFVWGRKQKELPLPRTEPLISIRYSVKYIFPVFNCCVI